MRKFTFELNKGVIRKELRFTNRFGIELAGDLYLPENLIDKNAALICCGAFGAVKEQASGFYANEMASRGFVTLAFDGSFTGESGGDARNVASADMMTEDVMAAVDELGRQEYVDRERIGIIGICGWGSVAINASALDKRIKAIATVSMFDISMGFMEGEARNSMLEGLAAQRWKDVDDGELEQGLHRFPNGYPENGNDEEKDMYDYYCNRSFHENSILSNGSWTKTNSLSLVHGGLLNYIKDIAPRPILLIHGENALTKGNSQKAYEMADEPKELLMIPDAGHCTLYDQKDKIPFERIDGFFKANL